MIRALVLLSVLLALALPAAAAAPAPTVVASVRPVHAIAAAVMRGVGTPQLLLGSGASLHAHPMKPSEARALSRAKVVFWVGPSLESFLVKPLGALAGKAQVVALLNAPGVQTLPVRSGGLWDAGAPAAGAANIPDGHIWLDPRNAVAMANAMAEILAVVDSDHAADYWANTERFSREVMALDRDLHLRLAPVREKPFLVFHDAYQYFESRYRLAALGSVSVTPEQPPGAGRLSAIQDKLREEGVEGKVCIFAEPQFEPRQVQMLVDSTGARTGVLDPEGVGLKDGPGLYFTLLRGLADELVRCLT